MVDAPKSYGTLLRMDLSSVSQWKPVLRGAFIPRETKAFSGCDLEHLLKLIFLRSIDEVVW